MDAKMNTARTFRDQCALLGLGHDELDGKIIIVRENHFWQARAISDLDWDGIGGWLLQRRLDDQEIPWKVLHNGNLAEKLSDLHMLSIPEVLAFISHPVVTAVGSNLLATWITDFLKFRIPIHRYRCTVEIESVDGGVIRIEADNYTADEVIQVVREVKDK